MAKREIKILDMQGRKVYGTQGFSSDVLGVGDTIYILAKHYRILHRDLTEPYRGASTEIYNLTLYVEEVDIINVVEEARKRAEAQREVMHAKKADKKEEVVVVFSFELVRHAPAAIREKYSRHYYVLFSSEEYANAFIYAGGSKVFMFTTPTEYEHGEDAPVTYEHKDNLYETKIYQNPSIKTEVYGHDTVRLCLLPDWVGLNVLSEVERTND